MKLLTITALSIATLSLTACATHGPHGVDETPQKLTTSEMLFSGISEDKICLLYTSPSPRDRQKSRMPSSA